MQNTIKQYDTVIKACRELFHKKMKDYGSAWRILRLSSLTDQIFIKAQRIRGLQKNNVRKIDEGQSDEFIGIINYSIMALIQLDKGVSEEPDLDLDESLVLYNQTAEKTKNLMLDKNHDYGEAWRDMEISSLTDLIIQKIFRMKSINNNDGETISSEGVESNFQDILNYSVFALILLKTY